VAADVYRFLERPPPGEGVSLLLADPPYGVEAAALAGHLDRCRLPWAAGAIRVIELARRDPLGDPSPGWRRWPVKDYGDTRILVEEREA
jgi:16S rRNA G966 N2-methylase RsmD